jgi:hypothetical protein
VKLLVVDSHRGCANRSFASEKKLQTVHFHTLADAILFCVFDFLRASKEEELEICAPLSIRKTFRFSTNPAK